MYSGNRQNVGINPIYHVYRMYRNAFALHLESLPMIYYMLIIPLEGIVVSSVLKFFIYMHVHYNKKNKLLYFSLPVFTEMSALVLEDFALFKPKTIM